ncbi:carboxylesterase [Ramaria rubella]|nr:carboxylesterase [Ramaria rubella]
MNLFTSFLFAALTFQSLAQEDGLTIQTQQGSVEGALVIPGVRRFLGIPYAIANRWEAPQLPPSQSTTFEATNFGDTCVQELNAANLAFLSLSGLEGQQVQESENCLSVNIWAPSSDRKQSTAVMLWIYGGGFLFGTSNTIFYDGQNLVRDNDDVILVTMNYRTNIFGFPNAPQLVSATNSQNFGLLDVDAAIKWVHDNIASFGGDPNRIVLFGQSAGSGIIDAYTYTHLEDTIVKGVIEESGSAAGQLSLTPSGQPLSPTAWNAVATTVGCGNTSTAEQFTCMQAVPFRTLENAVLSSNVSLGPIQDSTLFYWFLVPNNPILKNPDITFPSDINARSSAGEFLKVPLLIGNTANEGDIFIIASDEASNEVEIPVLTQIASDAVTEVGFACPASTTANDRVKAGVPTWSFSAIFPDISSRPDLRAYHASEIPIVFGTYNSSIFGPPTAIEIAFSRYVQGAWVAFVRDPQQGLSNYGWPKYDPNTFSLAQLGNSGNSSGVVFTVGTLNDVGCALLDTVVGLVQGIIALLGSLL